MKETRKFIVTAVLALVGICLLAALTMLFVLPAITIRSWGFLIFCLFWGIIFTVIMIASYTIEYEDAKGSKCIVGIPIAISTGILLLLLIGGIASGKLFNAKKYSEVANIKTATFEDMIVESDSVDDIALMDTETAKYFGERTLGELADLVSVYDVSEHYTTINLNGKPMKVSPLEYDGFVKYWNNKNAGIPGYVLVDPVNNTAKYVQASKPIFYSPSASFGKNLARILWFYEPSNIYGDSFFELDEEGGMYWITPVYEPTIGLFGAKVVTKVVITDANSGECKTYAMDDVPSWVDIVIDGDTICNYYNWYGTLRNGFWNSVFAQNGCVETTDDFGYKTIGDDVYIYTGVTSCNNSKSAVGFVLANSRTGEMTYMAITGAEEHSAMEAAQGEVSDYGWQASFPSIVNINGEPAYLMVLKDDNNIVKRYAIVNVKSYNIVAIDTTQKKVFAKYERLLNGEDVDAIETTVEATELEVPNNAEIKTITISEINFIVNNGDTTVYVKDNDGNIYRCPFDETWIIKSVGDKAEITYTEGEEISQVYEVK